MLRSLLRLSGAIALALLASPLAPSFAQTPGIAYDEIVRVVVNATPPPPGNFQSDVAALNAPPTAAPTAAPRRRGIGLGAIAGALLSGGGLGSVAGAVAGEAASNAMADAVQNALGAQFATLGASLRSFLQPHLMRYAYYNGWERVDDVTDQTATIRKCDMGQVYHLDLARKTYSVYDPNSEPVAPAPAVPAARGRAPAATATPGPPGTAVAVFTSTTTALGPLRIDNQPTSGYRQTTSFAMTQSTGSCRDASASITMQQYLSNLAQPTVASCPMRRAPIPESPVDVAAPPQPVGGCRPTLQLHADGPPMPSGKLALYTLLTMNAGATATPAPGATSAPGIGFLTERGNVRNLTSADAALFGVPADFTRTP